MMNKTFLLKKKLEIKSDLEYLAKTAFIRKFNFCFTTF